MDEIPKTQTENSGGDGPRKNTRIGAESRDDGCRRVRIDDSLTAQELARKLQLPESKVIRQLFEKNIPRTLHQFVELDVARDLAEERDLR